MWMELQVKKLNSLALKYDKELAAYDYKKQLEFSKFTVDDLNVKSVPIYDGIHRNKVMNRKKRKKAEERDLSSYVSNHSIFSYYGMYAISWLVVVFFHFFANVLLLSNLFIYFCHCPENKIHGACMEDFRGDSLSE